MSQYHKGKNNLDFTEARDSDWQWHQISHMQVCTSFQTDNYASTPPLKLFYRLDALPVAQPTASKHWRHTVNESIKHYITNNRSRTSDLISVLLTAENLFVGHRLLDDGARVLRPRRKRHNRIIQHLQTFTTPPSFTTQSMTAAAADFQSRRWDNCVIESQV